MNTVAPVPGVVRGAGLIVAGEGAAALLVAALLVLRGLAGADEQVVNGFATAALFALVGSVVLVAARALLRGRRWGRGVAVFANLTLLPIAWYVGVGSQRWGYGIASAAMTLAVLGLLLSPAAVRWAARSGSDA